MATMNVLENLPLVLENNSTKNFTELNCWPDIWTGYLCIFNVEICELFKPFSRNFDLIR